MTVRVMASQGQYYAYECGIWRWVDVSHAPLSSDLFGPDDVQLRLIEMSNWCMTPLIRRQVFFAPSMRDPKTS